MAKRSSRLPGAGAADQVASVRALGWVTAVLLALVAIMVVVYMQARATYRQPAEETTGSAAGAPMPAASQPAAPGAAVTTKPAPPPPSYPPADANAERETPPQTVPAPHTQPAEVPMPEPAPQDLGARLDALLPMDVVAPEPEDLVDQGAVRALLLIAGAEPEDALDAQGWARLSVAAVLAGTPQAAEQFAARAQAAGAPLASYHDVVARALLASGDAQGAKVVAQQLVDETGGAETARALLAAAQWDAGEQADAAQTARAVRADDLPIPHRLHLARVLASIEDWRRLAAAVPTDLQAPPTHLAVLDLLRAVAYVHTGRNVEALGALEFLTAHVAEAARTRWWWPPTRYEVGVWRGVALATVGQAEAGREALLAAAQLQPGGAAAYYQLGLLEAAAGQDERAATYLRNATTNAPEHPGPWQALGLLALNAGNIDEALADLRHAIELNPQRAAAHFALALAQAKLAQREATWAALRTAVQLEPHLLAEAQQAEIITRLFTPAELQGLLQPAPGDE